MDRGAWQTTVHVVTRVGHNLVTKPPQLSRLHNFAMFKRPCSDRARARARTHTHTHTPFYREERAMSILKPDGETEEEKNKTLYGFLKKICVIS